MNENTKLELKTISLDELEKIGLVTGDVYSILSKTKKEITLLRAGEYVLPAFIDKFRIKGFSSFYLRATFEESENELWKKHWNEVSNNEDKGEFEIYQKRKEFISHVKSIFFDGEIKSSLLSYMSITHQKFVGLSPDFMYQYAEKNYLLFKRSMLVASLSLPLVISMGYYETNFIKDIYNTILLLSYHLSNKKFTVTMKNALSLESMEHGLGIKYLETKSPNEVKSFGSVDEAKQISEVVYQYHHEHIKDLLYYYQTSIGMNLSEALSIDHDMPDWVSSVLLIDKLVEYEDFNFQSGDASCYLKTKLNKHWDERFKTSFGFKKIKNVLLDFWGVQLLKESDVA